MKQKILKQLCMALCLFANTSAMAQAGVEIDGIFYNLGADGKASLGAPDGALSCKWPRGDCVRMKRSLITCLKTDPKKKELALPPETVTYRGKTYTVTGIDWNACSYCGIQYDYFDGYSGYSLTIPNSVTYIDEEAFWYCQDLGQIIIGDNVKKIDDNTFFGCHNLHSVTIGKSVTSIGRNAFSGCRLTSVTIPNSVESIGESAFFTSRLAYVSIGSGVTSIGKDAFSLDWANATEVWCHCKTPPSADENSFSFTRDAVLYVPWGSVEAYRSKKPWSNFGRIEPFMVIDIDGIETLENDREETSKAAWYTIDGKKLAGEPTRKGVYIVNGKKVMK